LNNKFSNQSNSNRFDRRAPTGCLSGIVNSLDFIVEIFNQFRRRCRRRRQVFGVDFALKLDMNLLEILMENLFFASRAFNKQTK